MGAYGQEHAHSPGRKMSVSDQILELIKDHPLGDQMHHIENCKISLEIRELELQNTKYKDDAEETKAKLAKINRDIDANDQKLEELRQQMHDMEHAVRVSPVAQHAMSNRNPEHISTQLNDGSNDGSTSKETPLRRKAGNGKESQCKKRKCTLPPVRPL